MYFPSGDHAGCIASSLVKSRFAPVSSVMIQSSLAIPLRVVGKALPNVLTTNSLPSGDHAG
jgi:hypothetical protein